MINGGLRIGMKKINPYLVRICLDSQSLVKNTKTDIYYIFLKGELGFAIDGYDFDAWWGYSEYNFKHKMVLLE